MKLSYNTWMVSFLLVWPNSVSQHWPERVEEIVQMLRIETTWLCRHWRNWSGIKVSGLAQAPIEGTKVATGESTDDSNYLFTSSPLADTQSAPTKATIMEEIPSPIIVLEANLVSKDNHWSLHTLMHMAVLLSLKLLLMIKMMKEGIWVMLRKTSTCHEVEGQLNHSKNFKIWKGKQWEEEVKRIV